MTLRIDEEIYQSIWERAVREHRSVHAEILAALDEYFRGGDGISEIQVGQRRFRTGTPNPPKMDSLLPGDRSINRFINEDLPLET